MPNSGLAVTPGSGANVAVNQVSSLLYQVVKLDFGTDGNTSPAQADGSGNLKVNLAGVGSVNVPVSPAIGATFPVSAPTALPISASSAIPVSSPSPLNVNGSSVIASCTGTVTANQGTAASSTAPWPIEITDGANGVVAVSTQGGQKCLNVNVLNTIGAGAQQDKTSFTEGTSNFDVIGGEYQTAPTLPANGQAAAAQITQYRGLHVNIRNSAGTEIATSSNPLRIDPVGTTTQPVSGTVTAALSTSVVAGASAITADYDTSAGVQNMLMLGLALPASGGAVAGGTSTAPVRIDPVGTTTQPTNTAQIGGSNVVSAAAGVQKVGLADGNGNGILGSNPLQVNNAPTPSGFWKAHNAYTASQTSQVIHTPTSGKTAYVEGFIITATGSGSITVYDNSNAAGNIIYQGTPPVGGIVLACPARPIPMAAVNDVIRYDTGASATGDVVMWGYDQ